MPAYLRTTILLLLLIGVGLRTNAQQMPLQVKVTDAAGNPVSWATIRFKGTHRYGTFTNTQGVANISRHADIDSMICSHTNYISKTEYIKGNSFIHVVLEKEVIKELNMSVAGTHTYSAAEMKQFEEDSLKEIQKLKNPAPAPDEERIFTRVEMQSEFPGGDAAIVHFLKRCIEYPDSSFLPPVQGTVKVKFVISKDGSVSDITLIKGVSPFCDSAVIDAVKRMPKWKPALQNGRNVTSYKELSVYFDVKGIYPLKPVKKKKKK